MIVLGYTHNHKGHGLRLRAGRELIRLGQWPYTWRRVTHTEMLLHGRWDCADIASSSLMDGGVRIKEAVRLNPDHWIAIDVPTWDAQQASAWFFAHKGKPYDTRGAVGSVLYGLGEENAGWFCNEACGASVGQIDPHTMPPAGFIAFALRQPGARIVTTEFFSDPNTNNTEKFN
jgi:hypothetical protein